MPDENRGKAPDFGRNSRLSLFFRRHEVSLEFCTETEQRCSKTVTGAFLQATLQGMQAIELLEPIGLGVGSRADATVAATRYVRNSDLVSREVAGDTVVVPICRGVGDLDSIFTFNVVGTRLWALLAEAREAAELTTLVIERFQVSEAVAQDDVRNFLDELLSVGLVRTV